MKWAACVSLSFKLTVPQSMVQASKGVSAVTVRKLTNFRQFTLSTFEAAQMSHFDVQVRIFPYIPGQYILLDNIRNILSHPGWSQECAKLKISCCNCSFPIQMTNFSLRASGQKTSLYNRPFRSVKEFLHFPSRWFFKWSMYLQNNLLSLCPSFSVSAGSKVDWR